MASGNDRLKQFDAQLKAVAAPVLAEHGFARAGRTRLWTRPSATGKGVAQLVWFQVGESASSQVGKFTVEFGVYYPKYDRFANGRDLGGPVIGACHFDARARLGVLMQPPEDRWWPYSAAAAACAAQLGTVTEAVVSLGLPWLAAADTPEKAAVYNTGKLPEPDRLRHEAFLKQQKKRAKG